MSDIVKAQSSTPATSANSKRRNNSKKVKADQVQQQEVQTIAQTDLVDVAIAAADAPFADAVRQFNLRYAENLQRFGQHITNAHAHTAEALKAQLYGQYNVTEAQIYGGSDDGTND